MTIMNIIDKGWGNRIWRWTTKLIECGIASQQRKYAYVLSEGVKLVDEKGKGK